jgi:hypothetical protein
MEIAESVNTGGGIQLLKRIAIWLYLYQIYRGNGAKTSFND